MNSQLKISLIQVALHWEDPEANREMFTSKLASLKGATDIVLLPEMFSTGFTMNASSNAEAPDGPTVQWMRKEAATVNAVITGSLIIEENGNYYNRLIWMRPDGSYTHYDKRHLFRLAKEEQTYTPGDHQWIMTWKGWKIFPLVCYDLRFPVWSRRKKGFDFDLLLYVANWPERRVQAWKQLLPARAIENQSYVAGLNRIGDDGNGIYHSGDSGVFDFKGEMISSIPAHQECIQTVTLDLEKLTEFRQHFPFWQDADDFTLHSGK